MVIVPKPDTQDDSDVAAEFAKCQREVLQGLGSVAGLNVIAGERVSAFVSSGLSPQEIARQLGAGRAVILESVNHAPSCSARQLDVQTGRVLSGLLVFVDADWKPENWRSFAEGVAKQVEDATFKDGAAVIAEAQANVMNTSLSDGARIEALSKLRQGPNPMLVALDEGIVSAAAQIGTTSTDPQARESAWVWLRGIRDRNLVQPLLRALAADPAENVRRAAASTLGYFLDEPGVKEALTQAAAMDASDQPSVPCCIPTVREAVRLALLSEEPVQAAVRKILFDETLSPHERLLLMAPDGSRMLQLSELGDDAARAVFEIGSRSDDADMRSRAWSLLADVRDLDFVRTLLDDLANHPAERVRANAARGLRPYIDDPAVKAGLERAQLDPSARVRRAAKSSLDADAPFPLPRL